MLFRSDGATFRLSALRGQVTVVFFGYTSCPDVCPVTLAKMRALTHRLGDRADEVAVVFVSVDPARDTVEKLAHYVPAFDRRFYGVRLEGGALRATTEAWGVAVEKRFPPRDGARPTTYYIDHTGSFFVLDRAGRLRLRYPVDAPMEDVLADVEYLLDRDPLGTLYVAGARAWPSHGTTDGTAVYLTIVNPTAETDRLVGVASPAAHDAAAHETVDDRGVLRMTAPADGFEIPAHDRVRLGPGGKHIMLSDLVAPLDAGETVLLTLRFQKAGTLEVSVPVGDVSG